MKATKKINYDEEYIMLYIARYAMNNNLYIGLIAEDGPYSNLTTNTDTVLAEDEAAVDTNNFPQAEEFIATNKLGEPTGQILFSGFCAYPVYKFNMGRCMEYAIEEV